MPSRVLIIDDEWTIAKALSSRLGLSGFDARSAPDGVSGLRAAADFRPDAILLDLRMPDMDGFEVLRRLRADDALAHIPVIILSANVQDSVRQEAMASGAAAFFCKPYEHKQVIASLHRVIGDRTPSANGANA